jgi:tRNA A37 N6-isopentenylltransferase MiaA
MKAIGLRQLYLYFSGLQSLTDAIEDAKRESRRFAKRQLTWFRNQPPKGQPLLDQAAQDAVLADIKGLSF